MINLFFDCHSKCSLISFPFHMLLQTFVCLCEPAKASYVHAFNLHDLSMKGKRSLSSNFIAHIQCIRVKSDAYTCNNEIPKRFFIAMKEAFLF